MHELLRIGLCNALGAALLAVVALLAGLLCRRPALTHALWLLVLLKLVTPPLWSFRPENLAESERPAAVAAPQAAPDHALPDPELELLAAVPWDEQADAATEVHRLPGAEPTQAAEALPPDQGKTETPLPRPEQPAEDSTPWPSWRTAVGTCWLTGSGVWLLLATYRTGRFRRLLRQARPAPAAVQADARRLAARLGLARCPGVWMVPGRVSPMLWSLGSQPSLFLPAALWGGLGDEGRAALLVHELAHLVRRDHWVRGLELLTTCLFWWHPVVWWARRELREAEEQCCDAWVVWALPRAAKAYALALVETLDFLSEARPALPAGASGAGQVHDLRRRLTMIMSGTTPRRLGWGGVAAVLAVAAVLPLLPAWALAQQPPKPETPQDAFRKAEVEQAKAQVDKAKAEMEAARVRVEQMRADLAAAEARLKAAMIDAEKMAHLAQAEAQLKGYQAKLQDGQAKTPDGGKPQAGPRLFLIIQDEQGRILHKMELPAGAGKGPDGDPRWRFDFIDKEKLEKLKQLHKAGQPKSGEPPPPPGAPGGFTPGGNFAPGDNKGPWGPGAPGGKAGPDVEQRLRSLEQRLEQLMIELKKMHQQMQPGDRKPGAEKRPGKAEEEAAKAFFFKKEELDKKEAEKREKERRKKEAPDKPDAPPPPPDVPR